MAAGRKHVPRIEELLNECVNNADNVSVIHPPKDPNKDYNGCKFYGHALKYSAPGIAGENTLLCTQDEESEHIEISHSLPDPNDPKDSRNGYKVTFATTVSKSGKFGETMALYDTIWRAKCQSIWKDEKWGKRNISGLLQTHYSEECPKEELRNQPIEDPVIRVRMDPFKLHTNHPIKSMNGKPQTLIYDYASRKVLSDGRVQYDEATVDGEPLTESNLHLFMTRGSVIHKGRFRMNTVARSKYYVSLEFFATVLYVKHVDVGGYDDEEEMASPEEIQELQQALAKATVADDNDDDDDGDDEAVEEDGDDDNDADADALLDQLTE